MSDYLSLDNCLNMGFFNNVLRSIDSQSSISVNGITLLVSSFIGVLLGITMCIVLIIDVCTNGYIKTDLTDAGIFLLCSGGYIAGSGVPKTIVDARMARSARFRNNKKFEGVSDLVENGEDFEDEEETEEEEIKS